MKLKVCGMKYTNNIVAISKLEPDYLGFIFWEKSPRYFNKTIPELPKSIKKIGVFVNATITEILTKINQYNLDLVQLHGNETALFCNKLQHKKIKIIKAFSINKNFDFEILSSYESVCDYFLFDTKGKSPGGNGTTFNWDLLQKYSLNKPYFLSGGIGLEEVQKIKKFKRNAISKHCIAIDVNSRFESQPGLKKEKEVLQFKKLLNENQL